MTRWLLDDGPIGVLAVVNAHHWSWPADTLHVVEEVKAGAANDRSKRRQALFAMENGGEPCIRVHAIPTTSVAADHLFNHLRTRTENASRDLGEDASIAYCMGEDPLAVFVAMDKRAAYVALAELGPGRVASVFDCWASLRDDGLITAADFDALSNRAIKGDNGLPGLPRRFAASAVPARKTSKS
jgi:hypothetical protein